MARLLLLQYKSICTLLLLCVIIILDGFSVKVQGSTICDYLADSPVIQSVVPINSTLYLMTDGYIYTMLFGMPDTNGTDDDFVPSLTIGSGARLLGQWTDINWLKPFAVLKPDAKIIAASLFQDHQGQPAFTSIWYDGDNQCTFYLEKPPSKCIKTDKRYKWIGVLGSGDNEQMYFIKSLKKESKQKEGTWIVQMYIGEAANLDFANSPDPGPLVNLILQPKNDTFETTRTISGPIFGFISSGQVHLWLPEERRVLLFDEPGESKESSGFYRLISFSTYFTCINGAPKDLRDLLNQDSIITLIFFLVMISLIFVFIILGINHWNKSSQTTTSTNKRKTNNKKIWFKSTKLVSRRHWVIQPKDTKSPPKKATLKASFYRKTMAMRTAAATDTDTFGSNTWTPRGSSATKTTAMTSKPTKLFKVTFPSTPKKKKKKPKKPTTTRTTRKTSKGSKKVKRAVVAAAAAAAVAAVAANRKVNNKP